MNKFAAFTKKFEDSICEEDSDTSCTHCNSNQDNDQPCPYNRANLYQCINQEISYEEYIIFWPHTLIFEITQRDGQNYNSSHQLDFPFQLCYEENNIPIEYILTARVYSTSSSGQHFYIIEYFWDKGHQYYNTNNEGEDDETIQKESEPDSYNKKYNN
ncbi:9062_t:CDS:2 [Entrophospora sp. SA101]|nr:9062_t:CDS:2 [Entrophospora sp. SA101]